MTESQGFVPSGAQLLTPYICPRDAYPDYGAAAPEPGNTTATFALSIYVADVDATMKAAENSGAQLGPVQ
jgi:hypothetical protein